MENIRTIPAHEPEVRHGFPALPEEPKDESKAESDNRLHRRLLEWYTQEREKQAENRYERALDEDYYDHLQWSDEEIQELEERGQAPYVFNMIKPAVDWLLGTEKRMRFDTNILPREEDDVKPAALKKDLLKYVNDVNRTQFARSQAFADAAKSGLGWLEDGIDPDPEQELLDSKYVSWRNMLHDSTSVEMDLRDCRFIFRWKYVDLDIAQAMFPDHVHELRSDSSDHELFTNEQDEDLWYLGQNLRTTDGNGISSSYRSSVSDFYLHNRRERVKLIECWYRDPVHECICHGELFDGQVYDPNNKTMRAANEQGVITLYKRLKMTMRCAVFTEHTLLQDMESPYRHKKFPFTPVWGYRRKRDNAPYGVVRGIRDPQDDLNKRASKSLFLLSSSRTIGDVDAVEDWEELREEVNRPDAVIAKKKGSELSIERDLNLAQSHMQLMDRDADMIYNASGITRENVGQESNATSGKAINLRREQGSIGTTELFDNLHFAHQLQGEKQLSLMEQYYSEQKVFRVAGKNNKYVWHTVNEQDPETGEYVNDITARAADFIVAEQDYRDSMRQAMFEVASDIVGRLPGEVAIKFLDVVFELLDVPEKEQFVDRIRDINGYRDGDDDEDMSEEERAALEKQQQEAEELKMLEKAMQNGELRKILADALSKETKAMKDAADAGVVLTDRPDAIPLAADISDGKPTDIGAQQ